jgi:hypothetical protein
VKLFFSRLFPQRGNRRLRLVRGPGWLRFGRLRRPLAAPAATIGLSAAAPALRVFSRRSRRCLALQNLRPVEIYLGVVLFDPADGLFIQRRTAHFHAGRGAEPVEQFLPRASVAAAKGMDERRCFVPALVAREPQKWQGYLCLGDRAARADCAVRRDAGLAGFGFLAAAFFGAAAGRARLSLGAR